jgi:hypothetical protein
MLLYPEVQRHAQRHIDEAVGSSRPPTMEDEAQLPYVRCLVKETLSTYLAMHPNANHLASLSID